MNEKYTVAKLSTVNRLFKYAWRVHWQQDQYMKSGWAMEVWKYWHGHLEARFGHREARSIKSSVVREFHRELAETPVTANRCLEVLSRVFSLAEEHDLLPRGTNPCKGVKAYPERKRSRYATNAELARLTAALTGYRNTKPREVAFIELLLLTGMRPKAMMAARWEQLVIGDDGVGVLTAPGKTSSTTDDEEVTIFPPRAIAIAETLQAPTVLSSGARIGFIIGQVKYRAFWARVCKEASCDGLWLRDLRRTFSTLARSAGVSMDTIAALLNHRSVQTTKIYAKVLPLERIESAKQISSHVLQIFRP